MVSPVKVLKIRSKKRSISYLKINPFNYFIAIGSSSACIKTVPTFLYFIGLPLTHNENIPLPISSYEFIKTTSSSLQSFSIAACSRNFLLTLPSLKLEPKKQILFSELFWSEYDGV